MFVSFHTLCCHSSGISGCCTGLSSCIILLLFCCKDSANRVKNQIYLSFSEMQPIFGGVIPPKIRLISQISKEIRDYYPFVSVSGFWGVWHISSLLPQSITEMAVVGVTTAIRHLLAEAGGGGSTGFPHAPDFRAMIISSRSGR